MQYNQLRHMQPYCTSCSHPEMSHPSSKFKICRPLKKAAEVTINSAGDQLQNSAVIWRVAECPPLELLTGSNNFYWEPNFT